MAILLAGCSGRKELSRTLDFDADWLFHYGDIDAGEQPSLDDAAWRQVELPHDWMIEDLPGRDTPFDPAVENGVSSGFLRGGIAWYRKHFRTDPSAGAVYLSFGGVYQNASVWVNGRPVAEHAYGYSPFLCDITEALLPGADNLVAVRVDAPEVSSRWYSGAGIYRHVQLIECALVHVRPYSTRIRTSGDARSATVAVETVFEGPVDREAALCSILDGQGNTLVSCPMEGGKARLALENPRLWTPDTPELYRLRIELGGRLADEQDFGIRYLDFSTDKGFAVNGRSTLLKGGCIHHDNGALGAMAFDKAEIRKVRLLKDAGFNAVRTAHNPPSDAFLDACDSLGLFVMLDFFDVWTNPHFPTDYARDFEHNWRDDIRATVERFYNHPSIILWNSGNEIIGNDTQAMAELSAEVTDYLHGLDPDRPVTNAVNNVGKAKAAFLETLDVAGYNYSREAYDEGRRERPAQPVVATESYSSEAYDYWRDVAAKPWVIGDFVWTAVDYIGESSIGWYGYQLRADFFPWYLAYCGDIDICGERRPQSYFRQTLWSEEPLVYITAVPEQPSFPLNPRKEKWSAWDWPDEQRSWTAVAAEGRPVRVVVYSNCPQVELFLDGKSLGVKSGKKNKFEWTVPYRPGRLSAAGLNGGVAVCRDELATAGEVTRLVLCPDVREIRADGQDLCYIDILLLDAAGLVQPLAGSRVRLELEGPAVLQAFSNADPMDASSFTHADRKAWRGRCQAVIRAAHRSGDIVVRAISEDGLSDTLIIKAK